MFRYLIKNALVVSEMDEAVCDLLVEDETIAALGTDIQAPADCEVINATGKILVPGGVDVHTHLNLDVGIAVASDDFYTGTAAAAFGGTTTIVDHPGFGPAGCSLGHQIEYYHTLARNKALIDYGFHGVIQHVNDEVLDDMATLAAAGVSSFKIYLTYDYRIDDGDALRVLERAAEQDLLIAVHPENHGMIQTLRARFAAQKKHTPHYHPLSRPVECEAEAINRIILCARTAGEAPVYIVHLSNGLGLEYIRAARQRGQKRIYAETCPQYLLLDERLYDRDGNEGLKYIMCPPLRTSADNAALWQGLCEDVDTVATDHCPFFFATQKMMGADDFMRCPSGAPGIEERMPLLFSEGVMKNRITLRRFVELCCTNPAKLAGIYPQKGVLRVGSDADLAIIDPAPQSVLRQCALHSHVDYTAYEGFMLQGRIEYVFSRGEIIIQNNTLHACPGRGRFLVRGRCTL
ncbi:MAG: dihydropyrimidinase [Spirochaetaceae bacterium]|jgi:dihydropyrimidinase|nr:dihydropyrimidinase [Spirochaetaceae bacterium]